MHARQVGADRERAERLTGRRVDRQGYPVKRAGGQRPVGHPVGQAAAAEAHFDLRDRVFGGGVVIVQSDQAAADHFDGGPVTAADGPGERAARGLGIALGRLERGLGETALEAGAVIGCVAGDGVAEALAKTGGKYGHAERHERDQQGARDQLRNLQSGEGTHGRIIAGMRWAPPRMSGIRRSAAVVIAKSRVVR